jgi:hypothetical protein
MIDLRFMNQLYYIQTGIIFFEDITRMVVDQAAFFRNSEFRQILAMTVRPGEVGKNVLPLSGL